MHTSLSVGELKKKKEIEEDGKIVVLPISIKMLVIFLASFLMFLQVQKHSHKHYVEYLCHPYIETLLTP